MNILFLTRKWPPAMGGMETYCERLVARLRIRHSITLYALHGQEDGGAPSGMATVAFGAVTALRLMFRTGGFDVVHGGDMAVWPLVLFARLRSRSAAVALSAHGTDVAFAGRDGLLPTLYRAYMRLGARLLSRAQVLANSEATKQQALALGFNRIAVIPLGADVASNGPPPPPTRRILFAGRLIRSKGLGWFVEDVLPHLPEDIVLEVAGTVWEERERDVLSTPRVNYLGQLDKDALHERMASALCVIVPTIPGVKGETEGFGLVAAEAAVAGAIVLAARIHGLTDAVIDGETGRLLPAQSASEWISAIKEIAALTPEARARLVAHSMATAKKHFSWERVAAETEAKYLAVQNQR